MTFPTKLVITRTRAGQDGDTLYAEPFSKLLGHRFTSFAYAEDMVVNDQADHEALSAWELAKVRSRMVELL